MVWPFLRAKSICKHTKMEIPEGAFSKVRCGPLHGRGSHHLISPCCFVLRSRTALAAPQTWWFKITAVSPLTFLEVRRLRPVSLSQSPSVDGAMLPPEALGQTLPCLLQLLVAPASGSTTFLGLWPLHSNLCFLGHTAFSSLLKFPSTSLLQGHL